MDRRLNEQRIPRLHFVEATAPIELDAISSTRPNLWNILLCAAEFCSFMRHESPWPLVMRTVHPGSGMAQIAASEAKTEQSKAEYGRMIQRFNASIPGNAGSENDNATRRWRCRLDWSG